MSHVNVFFAIEAPYGAFFTPVGQPSPTCVYQPDVHKVGPTAKFCDQCGKPVVMKPIEEPTAAFKAFCDERKVDPRYAYHQLNEDGWEWTDANTGTKRTIGLYRVQAVDDPENRDPRRIITALGIKVASAHEEDHDKLSALSFTDEDLAKFALPVREIAEAFKISGTPRLYVQFYVSY